MTIDINTTEPRSLIAVVHTAPDAVEWAPLIAEVGGALDLQSTVEVLPTGAGRGRAVDELLARASAVTGPVLVLPAGRVTRRARAHRGPGDVSGATGHSDRSAGIRRVLIPSDATAAVAVGASILRDRLGKAGVHATLLHVMTDENRPRMWEGSGHHAAAWFSELRRRHRAEQEGMTIVAGRPHDQMRAFATSADLVIILWHHDAAAGRASVLRSVLLAGIEVPHLLVPLSWIGAFGNPAHHHVPSGRAHDR